MKAFCKVIIAIIILFSIGAFFYFRPVLKEGQALAMIYGHYDSASKSASWVDIPFPNKEDAIGYFKERKGIVSVIFFQPYYENGKSKIFLLTKTIPTNITFDCHACLPLIGAAVFVRKINHWEIEAQNQFIMYDGEYAELPIVKLIEIGKDKFGLSLEFEHVAVSDREINIFVPYKGSIVNAYKEIIYYENFSECGYSRAIQCEAYTSDIGFDKSMNGGFYGLQVKKFGTIYSDKRRKMMPVDQQILYQFVNGFYAVVRQSGENYIPKDKQI